MAAGTDRPTFSVIIPAYNAAPFIAEAIESAIAQTYQDLEIIVVNDGSPDTEALEGELSRYASRIRYFKQENRGPAGARNTAIRAARGEYVALLDSDDRWLPELLESQLELLSSRPEAEIVYADELLFGESPLAGETFMHRFPSTGPVTFEALLANRCAVTTSTVVAQRDVLMAAGLFNERYRCSEDFDMWLRLAYRGVHFAYQTRVLARHREHEESITASSERLLKAQIEVLQQLAKALLLSAEQERLLTSRIARCEALMELRNSKRFLLDGRYREARQAVATANAYFHSQKLRLVDYGLRFFPGVLRFALDRRYRRTARS